MSTQPLPPVTEPPAAYSEHLVESICEIIRVDGLSDVRAGLLKGADAPSIHHWKRSQPRFTERLQRARSEYQRTRLARIREIADGKEDWRAQAWLAENPGTGTGLEEEDEEDPASTEPDVSPAFVITPAQLALLQQRRAIALREMNGE